MAEILLKVRKLPYKSSYELNSEAQHTCLEFLGVDGSQFCQYAMLSWREISEIIWKDCKGSHVEQSKKK